LGKFWNFSSQRGLRKGIYLLILFSKLLACYISYLLFQIILLLTKWRASFILIYDYLYIMSHMNLRLKFCTGSIKFLAPPLDLSISWTERKKKLFFTPWICFWSSEIEKIISRIDIVEMIIYVIHVKMINYELWWL
jgi:hypothetical protein